MTQHKIAIENAEKSFDWKNSDTINSFQITSI